MMEKDHPENDARMVNLCPVFISGNLQKTVDYYVEKLGFKYAKHYHSSDKFAAVYRDAIELIIIQAEYGEVQSNTARHGTGYDAYIDPRTPDGVDLLYREYRAKGVEIISRPHKTDYGTYEFVLRDIDGRLLGIGRVSDQVAFFADSNYL